MDKTIVTALLLIAGVVSVVMIFNAVYPAINQSSTAMLGMERRVDERFRSQIEVIHAVAYGVSTRTAWVWVKNVGASSVRAVEQCDVFFGPEGNYARIPYGSGASYWDYTIEGAENWNPSTTVKINIEYSELLQDDERYFVKVVLPNGVSDELYFTK